MNRHAGRDEDMMIEIQIFQRLREFEVEIKAIKSLMDEQAQPIRRIDKALKKLTQALPWLEKIAGDADAKRIEKERKQAVRRAAAKFFESKGT